MNDARIAVPGIRSGAKVTWYKTYIIQHTFNCMYIYTVQFKEETSQAVYIRQTKGTRSYIQHAQCAGSVYELIRTFSFLVFFFCCLSCLYRQWP